MALLSALLILAAVSMVAVGLSRDSITDYRLSHNIRLSQQQFYQADAGVNLGVQIARDILLNVDDGIVDPAIDYPGVNDRVLLTGGLTEDEEDGEKKGVYMGNFRLIGDLGPGQTSRMLFDLFPDDTTAQPDSRVEIEIESDAAGLGGAGIGAFAVGYDTPWRGGGGGGGSGAYYTIRVTAKDERTGVQSRVSTVYAIMH